MKKIGYCFFVFVASLFVFSLSAHAESEVVKLKITSAPQTLEISQTSAVFTVESQDESGNKVNVSTTTYISLLTTSGSGKFAASPATGPCKNDWATSIAIYIANETSHKSFCYKDETAGTFTITITVSVPVQPAILSDSQEIIVTAPLPPQDSTTTQETTSTTTPDTASSTQGSLIQSFKVKIFSFLPNPSGDDAGKEWVEIKNQDEKDVLLDGWLLDDKNMGEGPADNALALSGVIASGETKRFVLPPGAFAGVTDTVLSGTTNQTWIMWDVLGDVQNFVASTTPNFGWRIGDTNESSTSTRESGFLSRNSETDEKRPILEVAFNTPAATTTHVVINEVYYRVASDKGSDANNEWVEIYNPTGSPVDISGWKICDNSSCDTIPSSAPIAAKGFVLITDKHSTWGHWPGIPAETVLIELNSNIGGGLANDGDSVILKDGGDSVVDAMSYGDDTSQLNPSVPKSGRGKSLARIIKGYDYDTAFDWVINATPNPGTNPSEGGEEVMRFTSEGVEVAKSFNDLAPLLDNPQPQETSVTTEELATPECACSLLPVEDLTPTTTPEQITGGGGSSSVEPAIDEEVVSQTPDETASTTPGTEQPLAPETAPTEEPAPPVEPPAVEQPATEEPAPVVEETPVVQEAPAPETPPVQDPPPAQIEPAPAIIESQPALTPAPTEGTGTGGSNE